MKFRSDKSRITQERLKELVTYNPDTGSFHRNVARGGVPAGIIKDCLTSKGYSLLRIDGEQHVRHRLAWLYMTGEWPKDQIDHINHSKADNRWANLRAATHGQNQANSGPYKGSKSGLKGAYFRRSTGKWRSQIKHGGVIRHLGDFDTADEAHRAWARAAAELHGEFARAA